MQATEHSFEKEKRQPEYSSELPLDMKFFPVGYAA